MVHRAKRLTQVGSHLDSEWIKTGKLTARRGTGARAGRPVRREHQPGYWYGDGPVPLASRLLASIYAAVTGIRRRLYQSGWFRRSHPGDEEPRQRAGAERRHRSRALRRPAGKHRGSKRATEDKAGFAAQQVRSETGIGASGASGH